MQRSCLPSSDSFSARWEAWVGLHSFPAILSLTLKTTYLGFDRPHQFSCYRFSGLYVTFTIEFSTANYNPILIGYLVTRVYPTDLPDYWYVEVPPCSTSS